VQRELGESMGYVLFNYNAFFDVSFLIRRLRLNMLLLYIFLDFNNLSSGLISAPHQIRTETNMNICIYQALSGLISAPHQIRTETNMNNLGISASN
jgi:hypothetical protein